MIPSIHKIKEEIQLWPDINAEHHVVEKITTKDNKFHYYDAYMTKAEIAVVQKLKQLKSDHKINDRDLNALWKLIDAYGDRRYSEGADGVRGECCD